MTRFRIKPGHVARVRVAVGVAVFHVKNQYKVVAVGKVHDQFPSGVEGDDGVALGASGFLVKKAWRWW